MFKIIREANYTDTKLAEKFNKIEIEINKIVNKIEDEIKEIRGRGPLMGTVSIDPPRLSSGARTSVDVEVSGLLTTHKIHAQCQDPNYNLHAEVIMAVVHCPVNGTLRFMFKNTGAAEVDVPSVLWTYWAW